MELTCTTESLAAMAKISAQDTTPGHAFSTADLMLSITVNPRAELRLGPAFCSPVKLDVSSSRIEPSHPCIYIYACYDYDYKERTKKKPLCCFLGMQGKGQQNNLR